MNKNSIDFNSTDTYEDNTNSLNVYDKLFQEKSVMDQKRRNLVQTYQRDEILKNRSKERIGRKPDTLRQSRSANNLTEGMKNMQQSSQAAGHDTVSTLSKNRSINITIAKEVSNKLYQDAKRRQLNVSKSRSKSRSHSRNPRSNKYLKDLFEDNFKVAIINKNIKNKKLNYFYT